MRLTPQQQALRPMLKPLVESLLHRDEACRLQTLEAIRQRCDGAALRQIAAELVNRLGRRSEDITRRAISVLGKLGSDALPALILRFVHSRSPRVQAAVLATLGIIGPRLEQSQRTKLALDVFLVFPSFAADDEIREAREVLTELLGLVDMAQQRAISRAAREQSE